jgi:NifB/MoaA-like Fe-S oxidoreductase
MTSDEIEELKRARESLARRRGALARVIAGNELPSVESAEELAKVQAGIEAIDRALADAGQPYLSRTLDGPA